MLWFNCLHYMMQIRASQLSYICTIFDKSNLATLVFLNSIFLTRNSFWQLILFDVHCPSVCIERIHILHIADAEHHADHRPSRSLQLLKATNWFTLLSRIITTYSKCSRLCWRRIGSYLQAYEPSGNFFCKLTIVSCTRWTLVRGATLLLN